MTVHPIVLKEIRYYKYRHIVESDVDFSCYLLLILLLNIFIFINSYSLAQGRTANIVVEGYFCNTEDDKLH